jgi:putative transposase
MPQSLSKLYVHLIFSTQRRERLLVPSVRGPCTPTLATVLKNQDCPALKIA